MMKPGFVPALGTPLTAEGKFMKESMVNQVNMMIDAGCVGLLAMGSMGQQPYIPTAECAKVAAAVVEAAAGRVPTFVGAMDCSIARIKERLAAMENLDVAGFVFTAPYYEAMTEAQNLNFYRQVAKLTKHKIFIYDLPGVVKSKITYEMVKELLKDIPNLAGIKTADLQMQRKLMNDPEVPASFVQLFSGLDVVDVAYKYGIHTALDGMFTCTPANSKLMMESLAKGDQATAAKALQNILDIRDYMCVVDYDLWPAYSYAMNKLGCDGCFYPDYLWDICDESKANLVKFMQARGELL